MSDSVEFPHYRWFQSSAMAKLAIGAIGVVYGDIGTSPLYALRETFVGHHQLAVRSAARVRRGQRDVLVD